MRGHPLLRPFAEVHRGEVGKALALTVNAFFVLAAYYVLKTVREPLMLADWGAEVKTYATAAQVLLLLPAVSVYDVLARRFGRLRLMVLVTVFFALQLPVFALLGSAGVRVGIAFHIWVGIFNLVVIAQFWAFASDVCSPEEGHRLFALIGAGSSLGAVVGAWCSGHLLRGVGPWTAMCLAGLGLLMCLVPGTWVHRRVAKPGTRRPPPDPSDRGVISMIARDGYLRTVGLFTLMLSGVATLGEYALDRLLIETAVAEGLSIATFVGGFKADLYTWISGVALVLQLFVVSRVFRYLGTAVALVVPVLLAFMGYGLLALLPVLPLVAAVKVAEGGVAYSLQNTVRHALFLHAPRHALYRAKAVIDTLLWRTGDVLAAAIVWVGSALSLDVRAFVVVNALLCACWIVVVVVMLRERGRSRQDAPAFAA